MSRGRTGGPDEGDFEMLALTEMLGPVEHGELCVLCELYPAEHTRTDNRDRSQVEVCERCANTADVSPADDDL